MMKWNPALGEFCEARLEFENEFDKFAVAVKNCKVLAEHLSKGKTGQFTKTISLFVRPMKILAKLKLLSEPRQ